MFAGASGKGRGGYSLRSAFQQTLEQTQLSILLVSRSQTAFSSFIFGRVEKAVWLRETNILWAGHPEEYHLRSDPAECFV